MRISDFFSLFLFLSCFVGLLRVVPISAVYLGIVSKISGGHLKS